MVTLHLRGIFTSNSIKNIPSAAVFFPKVLSTWNFHYLQQEFFHRT